MATNVTRFHRRVVVPAVLAVAGVMITTVSPTGAFAATGTTVPTPTTIATLATIPTKTGGATPTTTVAAAQQSRRSSPR